MGTQARPGDPLRSSNPGPFVGKTKLWLREGRGGNFALALTRLKRPQPLGAQSMDAENLSQPLPGGAKMRPFSIATKPVESRESPLENPMDRGA